MNSIRVSGSLPLGILIESSTGSHFIVTRRISPHHFVIKPATWWRRAYWNARTCLTWRYELRAKIRRIWDELTEEEEIGRASCRERVFLSV